MTLLDRLEKKCAAYLAKKKAKECDTADKN